MQDWFYHDQKAGICLTFKAMTDCGVPEQTLWSASNRNSKAWPMIDHPMDKRRRLIVWGELPTNNKQRVFSTLRKLTGCKHGDAEHCNCGDPATYVAKQPIRKLVELDYKAEEYFRTTLLEMKVANVAEYVTRYTTAASWLNMLLKMNDDKRFIKKSLNLTLDYFFKHVGEIITSDQIDFPSTYQKLRARMTEYKAEGYACLISGKFGNKNTAKIGKTAEGFDEETAAQQTAIIRKLSAMHNNFDAAQVAKVANEVFAAKGWETVSEGTIYQIMKENREYTLSGARGKKVWDNERSMHVKRSRPEFPLRFFSVDGWTVELAFNDNTGKPSRLVLVVVLDVMNNYPIGYAIGPQENAELIMQANRNALCHINDLFGGYYQPRQMQADNYAIKTLTPFYMAMSHLRIPVAVGNAKAKPVEPYFKYLQKEYFQKQFNWTSFNVDASKKNQFNREYHNKIKGHFPTWEGVVSQIEAVMHQDRELKAPQYLAQWALKPAEEKILLGKRDMLMLFGKPTGYTNSLTGAGLQPTINGQKLVYDSFDPAFRALQHKTWKVIADTADLSSILVVSDDVEQLTFVLDQKRIIPMDVLGMDSEDHQYLHKIHDHNKTRREVVVQTHIDDAKLVDKALNGVIGLSDNSELLLKGMYITNGQQKDGLQKAKGLKGPAKRIGGTEGTGATGVDSDWEAVQMAYLAGKNADFDEYLD